MDTLFALIVVVAPFVLIAAVLDTVRVAAERGGLPDISLTYRAYSA